MLVEVAVPLPIHHTFTYRVPSSLVERAGPGSRVVVPFGRRRLIGLVLGRGRESARFETRDILSAPDPGPLLSARLLELVRWMASYYLSPPGEAVRVTLPPGLLNRTALAGNLWPARRQLAVTGLNPDLASLTRRQSEVMEALCRRPLPVFLSPFMRRMGCTRALIGRLEEMGAVEVEPVEVKRAPRGGRSWAALGRYRLTAGQQRVYDSVRPRLGTDFGSFLVHGVTGSGKTEIYLHLIAAALDLGKSALVLVPEIGLTPQISQRFRSWFGDRMAILHSGLGEGERFDQWRAIRQGTARVVVGTRSAVFAPLHDLAVIVVDEEQDGSYKQAELPRYHARDVALKRGQLENAVVLLGSATPQLETFYRSRHRKRMVYLPLEKRVLDRPLPDVRIVDMREEFRKRGKAALLSEELRAGIEDRLARGEQTLILLNRRGYSPALLCRSCGRVETCRHCSISLTFHQRGERLLCHYCGYARGVPRTCADCRKEFLYFVGEGTERVLEVMQQGFAGASIARLDRDTAQRKGAIDGVLEAFARGRTRILIGTQMIAKGHDFPNVTLVGVLSAEQALRLPDFRAAERTFQLLTQVAGRSGRGDRPGEVIIQTYFPDHYSLRCARSHDYEGFFEREIRFRRSFKYPPFTALANLLVQGREEARVRELSESLTRHLNRNRKKLSSSSRMRILGPAPAAIARIKGRHRRQILIKTTSRRELHEVLALTLEELGAEKGALKQVSIDVDPIHLL